MNKKSITLGVIIGGGIVAVLLYMYALNKADSTYNRFKEIDKEGELKSDSLINEINSSFKKIEELNVEDSSWFK